MKQQNLTFNLFKAFGCICVVFLHYRFPEPVGTVFWAMGKFGVPYFFAISGFFLFSKGEWDAAYIVRKIKHILSIILWAVPLFAVLSVLYKKGELGWGPWLRDVLSLSNLFKFLVQNRPLVYMHTWFLYALVYCYLFVLLCFHKKKQVVMIAYTSPLLMFVLALLQEFFHLHLISDFIPLAGSTDAIQLSSTFVYRALPFLFLGILIREHQERIQMLSLPPAILCLLFGAAIGISVAEAFLFSQAQIYIGSYIAVICAMLLSVKNPDYDNRLFGYIGGKLSLYIYVLHIAVGTVYQDIAAKMHITSNVIYQWSRPLVILILSILLSHLIVQIKSRAGQKPAHA